MNVNDQHPIFSIVVPTYNRAHLLPRCIKSVLNQTFKDFELIIADDGSTDQTEEEVASFHDNRIVYVRQDKNGGNAAARNLGILNARGKYVSFLDDDDEYFPHFLEKTYNMLLSAPKNVGFTWCGVRVVLDTPDGEVVLGNKLWQPKFSNREAAYLFFIRYCRVGTNNGLTVRRACFDSVGLFDEACRKAVDTEFLIRLVRAFEFRVVPNILVKFHDHSGPRVRKNAIAGAETYERIIQKHLTTLLEHRDLWAALHYKAGWQYYHAADKTRGRRFLWQAICRNPLHLKSWLALLFFESFGPHTPHIHRQISAWIGQFHLR